MLPRCNFARIWLQCIANKRVRFHKKQTNFVEQQGDGEDKHEAMELKKLNLSIVCLLL